jgi:hypothetical protein
MFGAIRGLFERKQQRLRSPVDNYAYEDLYDEDDLRARYEWSWGFDLSEPKQRTLVERIISLSEVLDQEFQVLKLSRGVQRGAARPGLSASPIVVRFTDFPTSEQVRVEVEEYFGGGEYGIRARTQSAVLLKTYTFTGPPMKVRSDTSRDKSDAEIAAEEFLEEQALEALPELLKGDRELAVEVVRALLAKVFGVSLPQEEDQSMDDRLLEEELENNPEFRRQYVKRLLAERLGENQGSTDTLDQLLSNTERLEKLAEMLGYSRGNKGGVGWDEAIAELQRTGQIDKVVQKLAEMGKALLQKPQPKPKTPSAG